MRSFGLVVLWTAIVCGCSLPRAAISPTGPRDAGPLPDTGGGGIDAFVEGVDAFMPPDAAMLVDAAPIDTGPPPIDTGPPCMPSSACSADGTAVDVCDASGMMTHTHCDRGCTAGACRPQVDCTLDVAGTIATNGTTVWDVCGAHNDNNDNHTDSHCPSFGPDGQDVILRIDVDRTSMVSIGASDVADTQPVDPCIYLRTACSTRASELECDDDGGGHGFDSRLGTIVLMPGEYFLVVDSFDGSGSGAGTDCGPISVDVAMTPL